MVAHGMTLFINGRFLTQPLSGVQRYALEMVTALDAQLVGSPRLSEQLGPVEVLVPHSVSVPRWREVRVRVVGGGRGHRWEQGALYNAARDGVLVSLGNCGPVRHRAQILCLHDAHLYEIPGAFSRQYRLAHRMMRPVLARRAAALMTVSRHSARSLSHHLGIPEDRFEVVANSAEHVLAWPRRAGVLERNGLTSGNYVLSVGNQSPNKNIGALVAAHQLAGPDVPALVIVGGAAPGVTAAAPGHSAHVQVLGRVPDADLRSLYEGAAGFVFPSLFEGFGIPPLEAMQLGVPVLCARSGAMPEVLGDGPMWFDPRDINDMARVLREFSAMDSAARNAMRVVGRAMAGQYRWDQSASRLIEIIGRVMGRDPRTYAGEGKQAELEYARLMD